MIDLNEPDAGKHYELSEGTIKAIKKIRKEIERKHEMTDTKTLREPLPRNHAVFQIGGTRREPMLAEFETANKERMEAADEIERLMALLGDSKGDNPKASKRSKTDD